MPFQVTDAKEGPCPLCLGSRQKQLFSVRSAGYCGDVCPEHLAVLLRQQAGSEQTAPPQTVSGLS